jgi:aspartate/methionine/tyrosine aminotransferase
LNESSVSHFLAARAVTLEETAPRDTTERARALRAAGKDVIELYGSPFWSPPEHVLAAARDAVGDLEGAPAEGLPALREAVAERFLAEKHIRIDPTSELLITNAANHGLYVVLTSILDPGDEVLMFSPHYYYQGIIELAGGRPRYCETRQADGWQWDVDLLEKSISPRTKVLLINTPGNPTGFVASRQDIENVAKVAQRHGLLILADEAYDHMVYDGLTHISQASLPGLEELCVTVSSCTKSYAMKYWRVGVVAGPAPLISVFRKVLEWNVFECNHVAQHAARAAYAGPQDWVKEISHRFERCRDLLIEAVADAPGLSFAVPSGGPFLYVDVDEARLGMNADAFRAFLLDEWGVAADAGGPFGSSSHIRLPFGGEYDVVQEVGRRILGAAAAGIRR